MFASFLNSLINAFSVVFQVFRMFFVWIFEHTWAFVLSIFLPLVTLFDTIVETVSNWINASLESVWGSSEYHFSDIFDLIDFMITDCLGDSFLSLIFKDMFYVFNLAGLFEKVVVYVVPFLLSCIFYKVAKSWIPTISGS